MVANIAITSFTSSAVVVYVLQKLKSASWFPWLQAGRAMLSRAVSIGAAAIAAIGINYTWSVNPDGTHNLVLMNLSLASIALGAWHWLNQYAMQETIYQATVNKVAVTTNATGAIPALIAPGGAVVAPAGPAK
jgi:hypothetical protein